jgi:hypothetical protein
MELPLLTLFFEAFLLCLRCFLLLGASSDELFSDEDSDEDEQDRFL